MDENIGKRVRLAIELMTELKDRRDHISGLTTAIGESSDDMLKTVYDLNQGKISEKVELFNKNVIEIKSAYSRITETMNSWHAFTSDEKEQKKLLFPLLIMQRRRDAKKAIQSCKDAMNSLIIKNRLIREDIIRLESTLEYEATKKLSEDVSYDDYNSHIKQKAFLLDALQYLLPTIPKMPFREINVDRIEQQIEKLAGMLAAE